MEDVKQHIGPHFWDRTVGQHEILLNLSKEFFHRSTSSLKYGINRKHNLLGDSASTSASLAAQACEGLLLRFLEPVCSSGLSHIKNELYLIVANQIEFTDASYLICVILLSFYSAKIKTMQPAVNEQQQICGILSELLTPLKSLARTGKQRCNCLMDFFPRNQLQSVREQTPPPLFFFYIICRGSG